jgi:hypothetical protein
VIMQTNVSACTLLEYKSLMRKTIEEAFSTADSFQNEDEGNSFS